MKNGYGLSVINTPSAHIYEFAWEVAVIKAAPQKKFAYEIYYNNILTDNIEVFSTDDEANIFIEKAFKVLEKLPNA